MSSKKQLFVVVAVMAGIAAGIVVAVIVPQHQKDRSGDEPGVVLPPVNPVSVAPKARMDYGDSSLRIAPGSVRIESRTSDPRGGPDWALRTYSATRYIKKRSRRPGVDPVSGHYRCAQLGRVYKDQFGWINPKGVFRPFGLRRNAFRGCRSQREDRAGKPFLQFEALIADPSQGATKVYETVIWGLAGRGAKRAALLLDGEKQGVALSPSRGFLYIGSDELHEPDVSVEVRGSDGALRDSRTQIIESTSSIRRLPSAFRERFTAKPVGKVRLEARTPDPGGGLPWGVAATRSSTGGWCLTQAARVIGDRVGVPQPNAGTMTEQFPFFGQCGQNVRRDRSRPVSFGWMYARADDAVSKLQRAARRTRTSGSFLVVPRFRRSST